MGLFKKKAKPILLISMPEDCEFTPSGEMKKDYHCIIMAVDCIKSPDVRILSESNTCNVNKSNDESIQKEKAVLCKD